MKTFSERPRVGAVTSALRTAADLTPFTQKKNLTNISKGE
jgi:hypothetical protein